MNACAHRRHEISAAETRRRHEHSSGPDGVRMAVKRRGIHTSELLPKRLLPKALPSGMLLRKANHFVKCSSQMRRIN